jgi:hypothetical protein
MKKKSPLSIQCFHVDKDGIASRADVPVTLTVDLHWKVEVPKYMVKALRLSGEPLIADRAVVLISMYEEIAERYQGWRLKVDLQPMLAIPFNCFGGSEKSTTAALSMSLHPVWASKDGKSLWERLEKSNDVTEIGIAFEFFNYLLLPDTPQVREKAQRLIDSLNVAADIINAVYNDGDFGEQMAKRFLSIGEAPATKPVEPQPAPVVAPKQAELPLEQGRGSPDDDDVL